MSLASYKRVAVAADKGKYGKWAEARVREVLQEMSDANLRFAFNRTLDARSAGGKFPAQAGDFQWFFSTYNPIGGNPITTYNGIIEVKEVEHVFRLPFKNLDTDGYARMHKRELAGSQVIVLVAHKLHGMTAKQVNWRCLPLGYFADRSQEKGVGSWDLSDVPYCDYRKILRGLIA